ncbi:hypothetical protein ACKEHR_000372 [Enterobacter hormaechei]
MNISANNAIDQAEKIITDIFENGEHDIQTSEGLYLVLTLLSDARSSIGEIDDLFFDAVITARKLDALTTAYCEQYFTDEDNERQETYLAAAIRDYASKACDELKIIEEKIN